VRWGTDLAVHTESEPKSCIPQEYPGTDYFIPLAKICNPMYSRSIQGHCRLKKLAEFSPAP
jgi:hypothetical protein